MKITSEEGLRAPGSLERAANSTYLHIATGKLYVQTTIPLGTSWKEEVLGKVPVDGVTINYNIKGELESLGGGAEPVALEIPASTINYYVDQATGSDTNDGLTTDTAFATMAAALAVLVANERVYVFPGAYAEDLVLASYSGSKFWYFSTGVTWTSTVRITLDSIGNYLQNMTIDIEGNGLIRYIGASTWIDTTDTDTAYIDMEFHELNMVPTAQNVRFIVLGSIGGDAIVFTIGFRIYYTGTTNSIGSYLLQTSYNADEGFRFSTDIYLKRKLDVTSQPSVNLILGHFLECLEDGGFGLGDVITVAIDDVTVTLVPTFGDLVNATNVLDATTEFYMVFTNMDKLYGRKLITGGALGTIFLTDMPDINLSIVSGEVGIVSGLQVIMKNCFYNPQSGMEIMGDSMLIARDVKFDSNGTSGGTNGAILNVYNKGAVRLSLCVFEDVGTAEGIAFDQLIADSDAIITNSEFAVNIVAISGLTVVNMHNVVGTGHTVNDIDSGFTVMSSIINQKYP